MLEKLKFFDNKRYLAAALCFSVIISLAAFVSNLNSEKNIATLSSLSNSILIIDAGHGGVDGGAIGVDGTRESDINLSIAHKLSHVCDFLGKKYVMTRVDDSRAADAASYSEHAELVYRAELTNSTENPVLISIHQNCFPTAQPSGPQVIYSNNNESRLFGQITHNNLLSCLDPTSRRLAEPDKNGIYILKNVTCPAILVECGFVSNHTDITKLTNQSYQTALSVVLMASYIQFAQQQSKV